MSTCTLADPGVAAGWPPLLGLDPFGRLLSDGDPLGGTFKDLLPVYNGPHSLTVNLGDTLPSGAGLAWDGIDPTILTLTGHVLQGTLELGVGVGFRGSLAAIVNTDVLDDPSLYTNPEAPHSGNLNLGGGHTVYTLDNVALVQPSGGAMKNQQWRVKIDPAGTGNFTLTLTSNGNFGKPDGTGTTAPIPVGATLAQVQAAVAALPFVGNAPSGSGTRNNVTVKGVVGDYVLIFDDGAFHDEIYIVNMTSTGPVLSITHQPGIYGGEGSAMQMTNVRNLIARKVYVHNFLADGPKYGGSNFDCGWVNSTIRAHPGRAGFGGHNDGFVPRALDNTASKIYAMQFCLVEMWSGNAAVYIAAGQTVQGAQRVIIADSLLKGPNKAIAQNGCNNTLSGGVRLWVDSTQIGDTSAHDEGSSTCPTTGIHGRSPEYVWDSCRRSDAQGANPRGSFIPPGSGGGVVWKTEPAGSVSICSGGGGGDTTPPTVPGGLVAVPIAGGVDLSWNASTDPGGSGPSVTVDASTHTIVAASEVVSMQLQASMKGDGSAGSDAAVANAASLMGAVAKGGQSSHMTGATFQLIDQNPSAGVFVYDGFSGSNRPLLGGGSAHVRTIKDSFTLVDAAGAGSDKILIAFGSEAWKHPSNGTNEQTIADPSHSAAVAAAVIDALQAAAARNGGAPYYTHVVHYQEWSKWRTANGLAALSGAPPAPWEADSTLNPDTWAPGTDTTYPAHAAWHATKSYNVLWDAIKTHADPNVSSVKVGGPYYAFTPLYPLGDGGSRQPVALDYDAFVYWLKWSHGFDFLAVDFSIVDYNDLANSTLAYITANAAAMGTLVQRIRALQASYPFPQASGVVAVKRAAPIDFLEFYWDTGVAGSKPGKPVWAEDDQALAEALVLHQLWQSGARKLHKWAAGGDAGGAGGTLRNLASWYRYPNLSSNPGNDASGALSAPNGPGDAYLAYRPAKLFRDNLPAGTQLVRVVSTDPDVVCTASAAKVIVTNPTTAPKTLPVAGHSTTIPAKGTVVVTV